MECYKWQAFIFSQIGAEADKRGLEVSQKVRWISDRMLEFILSETFRRTKYISNNQTYNKMIQLLQKNQSEYVEELGLTIPEPRNAPRKKSDKHIDSSEEDEDSGELKTPEGSSELKHDLEGVDLNSLDVNVLRRLCEERDLNVGKRAHKKTCIKALLSWRHSFGLAATMGEMKINDE
jgi:hypothetical protein